MCFNAVKNVLNFMGEVISIAYIMHDAAADRPSKYFFVLSVEKIHKSYGSLETSESNTADGSAGVLRA